MRASFAVAAGLAAVASAKTVTETATKDVTITSCEATVTNCPYKPTGVSTYDGSGSGYDGSDGSGYDGSDGSGYDGHDGHDGDYTWGDWTSTSTKPADPVTTASDYTDYTWGDWTTSTKPADPVTTASDYTWGDWTSTKPADPVTTASDYTDYTWGDWASSSVACGDYTATAPPAWFSHLPSDKFSSIQAKWTGGPPADWCYYTYSTSTLSTYAVATTSYSPVDGKPTGVWTYSSTPVDPGVATYTGAASANAGSLALAGLAAAAVMVIA